MSGWSRYGAGVVGVVGLLALVSAAGAETCTLEIRRFDATSRVVDGPEYEYWFRAAMGQSFSMQTDGPEGMVGGSEQSDAPEFSTVIQKEPSQYAAKHPLRGVAKLGDHYFGFVLDVAPAKTPADEDGRREGVEQEGETRAPSGLQGVFNALLGRGDARRSTGALAYQRLYFDLNRNGDLTDDAVIEATASHASADFAYCTFPATTVALNADGKQYDFAFTMNAHSVAYPDFSYVHADLNAAAYREGEMTIDGRTCRVVVVDFNSNGRFDDPTRVDGTFELADGTVYPTMGDMLYIIDNEATPDWGGSPYDPSTNRHLHYVSPTICVDGRHYDLSISPSGDELTLVPSSTAVGHVTNPNKGYRAVVYGEQGFLTITGDETGRASLPAGQWKLASYTIDRPATEVPAEAESPPSSWLESLARGLMGSPGRRRSGKNTLSARAKRDYQAVEVREGSDVELPFGEPYRPVVTIEYVQDDGTLSLDLTLIGRTGEVCQDLTVNGRRPGRPTFTIATEAGEVVTTDSFEYG
jgi:hypothetical protein